MRRLALVALFALACGALPVHAQALSLSYKSGDTFNFRIHSVLKEAASAGGLNLPVDIEMSAHETVKVRSVDAAGTSDLTITVSNLSVKTTSNGVTSTPTGIPDSSIEVKVTSDGRVENLSGTGSDSNPFTMLTNVEGGFFTAVLPGAAVRPGDSWSKSYDQKAPEGSSSSHITARSKYVRDESVAGARAAVVETNSTTTFKFTTGGGSVKPVTGANGSPEPSIANGDLQDGSLSGTIVSDVTSWIDPGGHRVVKSHQASTSNLSMKMTFTLPPGTPAMPGMNGAFSIKGTETTDLDPA